MSYVVRMPQLGQTMEEGVVVEWVVEEEEPFEEGDVIAVVESEKTTNEVKAREDGIILQRFVALNEPVEPGVPIAFVGAPDESVPEEILNEVENIPDADQNQPAASGETLDRSEVGDGAETGGVGAKGGTTAMTRGQKISPRARSYAREHGIPSDTLDQLDGTGPGGAVIEADVAAAADSAAAGLAAVTVGERPGAGRDVYEEREGSRLRQTIARRMTASARDAPQVTLNRRVPVDRMLETREQLAADCDVSVSIEDFVIAAAVEALREYPEFNAVYEDGVHKLARNVNVGIAVDIEDGLITPVIKGANRMTLEEIGAERSRLVELAIDREYSVDDLSDGTFTISNLGHFDIDAFNPILNPPEVAILGVCAIRPEYDPERETTVRRMGLSLTFDHRAVDGADAARFLDAIADSLAHPLALINLGGEQGLDAPGAFREVSSPAAKATGDRTARARSTGGLQADVGARRFEWRADEPEDRGGTDSAPTPVEQFLGSLSSCLTLMINNIADRRDVPVEHVDVTASADPPEGHIERIDVAVDVVSTADADDIERVVQTAERACYVNQIVDDDLEQSLSLSVTEP